MNIPLLRFLIPASMLVWAASCQDDHVAHIAEARLVVMEPLPLADGRLDETFRPTLELLCPFYCHDTIFIQDRVFLERIDLPILCRKEFSIAPNLLRDFFGSNNPGKRTALLEELWYGDSAFEARPDSGFFVPLTNSAESQAAVADRFLARHRRNERVYLFCADTACNEFGSGGTRMRVHHDPARLNCRIVSDLREMPREELADQAVVILVLPDMEKRDVRPDLLAKDKASFREAKPGPPRNKQGADHACPPDSAIAGLNRSRRAVITTFRNLLYYIATTHDDADLRRKFRDDALAEIQKIPGVTVAGIPGGDLYRFLDSEVKKTTGVDPVFDKCGMISGISIKSP